MLPDNFKDFCDWNSLNKRRNNEDTERTEISASERKKKKR